MIIHMDVWLGELKALHAQFDHGCVQNDYISIERSLYYSALIIRKLSETPFIRRGFLSPQMKGRAYEPSSKSVDGLNWLDASSHFDFDKGRVAKISLAEICNILIHSRFLNWRPSSGPVREILTVGGMRAGVEAIGFAPLQFTKMLRHVEEYKFKTTSLRPARRAA